ncbi:MAG: hypothetical protein IJ282_04925 [Lachnospiraceae bacterium]|nr:hypothetical protein [Lachnospiraceae bacterium]
MQSTFKPPICNMDELSELCSVSVDTQVTLADGRKLEVEHLRIGDLLYCPNSAFLEVREFAKGPKEKLWIIKANNIEIKVTGGYPFLTKTGIKAAKEYMTYVIFLDKDFLLGNMYLL